MTKITRTYAKGCDWCNATGYTFPVGISSGTIPCPVCNGAKVITVTEEDDALYEMQTPEIPLRYKMEPCLLDFDPDEVNKKVHKRFMEQELASFLQWFIKTDICMDDTCPESIIERYLDELK